MVMQFGTITATPDFQGYINNTVFEALDVSVLAYLGNVPIYSESEEEPVGRVMWIIQRLLDAG